ncbi:tetratricopeptide repeat protein [Steroidobacter flavus]|uniref:Tetratricopeptide repeat protein n=1 Tax=Steroidobacter flavus TaxID=1842136 RepID=A0ABV8T037_9GAMM
MQASTPVSSNMESPVEKLQQRLGWLRRDPDNASLYRQCADAALALRQYDVLLEIADQALSRDPDNASARFDRANARIGRREYREALSALAEIQPVTPEQSAAIDSNRAVCHYCLGEYEQALPLLMDQYRQGQRSAALLLMAVRANHHLSNLDEAAAIANANPQAAGSDAALAGAYALMFLDTGDAGSAARWSATALRLDARSIDGAITDGTLAVMRLQLDRAQRQFNSVLELAPETGRAWIGLGTLAMLQQDLRQAASHFERGLQSMPGYVGGWHMLGWAQLMQQDLEAAERSLNHALSLDRNFAETHGTLAALDALKGNVDSAKHRLELARRLDPDSFSMQFAAALLEDPSLKSSSAQQIMQQTLLKIRGQGDSALAKLLVQRPKR